ncbi:MULTISPECIES: hypothetical protein [Halorubrum]|nr:hypothetical protein [Halorubrum kocurii]
MATRDHAAPFGIKTGYAHDKVVLCLATWVTVAGVYWVHISETVLAADID